MAPIRISINSKIGHVRDVPVDPVCGIELDEEIALVHEHNGTKYYFCCNGCMKIFAKKPRKWSKRV